MRSRIAKIIGIAAVVIGVVLGAYGSLSFAVYAIDQGAAERCRAIEAPAAATGPSETSIVNADFSRLPRGLSCTWETGDGFATEKYPRWDFTGFEFVGYTLAAAGVVTLFVRRMVRPQAVVAGAAS